MRPYPGSSTPGKKNGGSSLARAPAICPESWGEGHRAKSLTGYAFPRKVANLGDEFPKPEHGGLCQLSQAIRHPRSNPVCFKSLVRDRYQFDCGAFTV
jgi:hypothetical protein